LLLIILFSCSSDKKNDLTFKNDIDQMAGWIKDPTIMKGEGHSGKYFLKVDSLMPYSLGFNELLSNISSKPLKKINFSAWCKANTLTKNVVLVCDVVTKENQHIVYKGVSLKDYLKNPNEWMQISGDVNLPSNLPADAKVLVYLWTPQKEVAYIDDYEISFE